MRRNDGVDAGYRSVTRRLGIAMLIALIPMIKGIK